MNWLSHGQCKANAMAIRESYIFGDNLQQTMPGKIANDFA
jgi:hypothetical protein